MRFLGTCYETGNDPIIISRELQGADTTVRGRFVKLTATGFAPMTAVTDVPVGIQAGKVVNNISVIKRGGMVTCELASGVTPVKGEQVYLTADGTVTNVEASNILIDAIFDAYNDDAVFETMLRPEDNIEIIGATISFLS